MKCKKFNDVHTVRKYGKDIIVEFSYVCDFKFRLGFVYLVCTEKIIKVGISSDLNSRMKAINNSLIEDKIECIYVSPLCENRRIIEKNFKAKFAERNIKNEWFDKEHLIDYLQFMEDQSYLFEGYGKEGEEEINMRIKEESKQIIDYFLK